MERVLSEHKEFDEAVFLGDWFDTHGSEESASFSKTCEYLLSLFEHQNRSKFVFLVGNHDAGYIYLNLRKPHSDNPYYCSGVTKSKVKQFQRKFAANGIKDEFFQSNFKAAHLTQGFLMTHAGVHTSMVKPEETAEEFEVRANAAWHEFRNLSFKDNHLIRAAGRARGGYHPYGGVLWLDWHMEFSPHGIGRQLFGHTSIREAAVEARGTQIESWNIDFPGYAVITDGAVQPVAL